MRQQPSHGRPRVGGSQAARRAAAHERKHLPACSAAQGYLNCDMINKRTLKIGSSDNYSRRLREVDFLSQTRDNYRAHGGGRLVGHVHEPARSEESERDPGRFRHLVTATAAGHNPASCPAFSHSGSSPCRPARPANSERTQSDVEFEAHQLVTSATQRFLSSVRTISGVSLCRGNEKVAAGRTGSAPSSSPLTARRWALSHLNETLGSFSAWLLSH